MNVGEKGSFLIKTGTLINASYDLWHV